MNKHIEHTSKSSFWVMLVFYDQTPFGDESVHQTILNGWGWFDIDDVALMSWHWRCDKVGWCGDLL